MPRSLLPPAVDIAKLYNAHLDIIARSIDRARALLVRCADAANLDDDLRSAVKKYLQDEHGKTTHDA